MGTGAMTGLTSAPGVRASCPARPPAPRRCGLLLTALLAVLLTGAVGTASAATTVDIRGTYVGTAEANGSHYSNQTVIDQEDCAAGTFSGHGVGYSNFSGTINGNQLVTHEIYTSGNYSDDGTGTISMDTQGRLVNSGVFHDSNGTSGTYSATRVSTPPGGDICSPISGKAATVTKLSCGYQPLLAQDDCQANVVDTSAHPTNPTGVVTFNASRGTRGNGTFAYGNTCSLRPSGQTGTSSCTVVYLPPTVGLPALQADYGGDATHSPSTTGTTPGTHASCPASKSKAVTCANPGAPPGVCRATGPTYPQCSEPTLVPVACSRQATGSTCQSSGNYTVACGSIGTGLPECAQHPRSIANVCGPSSNILPPCTGANNPVTACGPIGSGLPACSFTTRINAAVLDPTKGTGEVDVTVDCGSAQAAGSSPDARSRARASGPPPSASFCRVRTSLEQWFADQNRLLGEAETYAREIYAQRAVNYGRFIDPQGDQNAYRNFSSHNSSLIQRRIGHVTAQYFNPSALPPVRSYTEDSTAIETYLADERSPLGNFIGPEDIWNSEANFGAIADYTAKLLDAVSEARRLLTAAPTKSTRQAGVNASTTASSSSRPLAGQSLRLRAHHRVKLRLRLSSATVRSLIRAGIKRHAVPLRLLVVYRTKRGVVARFIDFPLRSLKAKRPARRGR